MRVQESRKAGAHLVRPEAPRLDAGLAPALQRRLDLLADQGAAQVVLDLGGVQFMDSSGLAAVAAGFKRLRAAGGQLAVCGLNDNVEDLFRLTKLDRVVKVYPSAEAALEALGGGA
jgi:anti-sigma B factor antagonist